MATWAAEKAKIELSQKEESVVSLAENELGVRDQAGEEIYLDIPLIAKRTTADRVQGRRVHSGHPRELEKAGLSRTTSSGLSSWAAPALQNLRDKVAFELGIAPSTDVNPMTAVAEGAAVFAESIDWASQSRGRKSARGALSAGGALDLSFNYIARTPEPRPRSSPSCRTRLRASSFRSTAWTRAGRLAASR
jgi:molecular chaperone DnaK